MSSAFACLARMVGLWLKRANFDQLTFTVNLSIITDIPSCCGLFLCPRRLEAPFIVVGLGVLLLGFSGYRLASSGSHDPTGIVDSLSVAGCLQ
ncbi:hypothetical protein OH492_10260 [Vibrio chagasii]|nr:hypothetical protein [Vibrio chagasii]